MMKQIIVCLILLMIGFEAKAQTDTVFYYMNYQLKPCPQEQALYYRYIWQEGTFYSVLDYYYQNNTLKEKGMYLDSALTKKTGLFVEYRKDQSKQSLGVYANGIKKGPWRYFHRSGKVADSTYYGSEDSIRYAFKWNEKGKLIYRDTITAEDERYRELLFSGTAKKDSLLSIKTQNNDSSIKSRKPEKIYTYVERMPQYPGGGTAMMKYLSDNLIYPVAARYNKIEGKVVVSFLVDEFGTVSILGIKNGIGGGCDEEAIRVVANMPDWLPGSQNHIPVKVYFTLPINFALN